METIKKSVVTDVKQNVKQWQGNNGTVYYHTITFENGDSGQYGSKEATCTKFVVGQETEYSHEVKTNGQYTNVTIKPVSNKPAFNGGGFAKKDDSMIAAQSCLGYSAQFYQQRTGDEAAMFALAQKMYEWVMAKKTL